MVFGEAEENALMGIRSETNENRKVSEGIRFNNSNLVQQKNDNNEISILDWLFEFTRLNKVEN